ncbi:MAG: glycosyltransferase family 2 protein [Saprospiraceae bacterium]
MKILAVIPAYNEEASIEALLYNYDEVFKNELQNLGLLIVNDGSKDNTVQIIKNFKSSIKIDLIDNEVNGGLGKVIHQGLISACHRLQEDDIIITMDGDNSHLPDLIPSMIKNIDAGSDLVIASRYRKGSRIYGLSFFRKLTGFLAGSLFIAFASLRGVRDYTCGYRAYKVSILKKGIAHYGDRFIEENGFSCMVEILLKLNLFNPVFTEVPMILRYDLKLGASKMKVWQTTKNTLAVLWQYRFGQRFK